MNQNINDLYSYPILSENKDNPTFIKKYFDSYLIILIMIASNVALFVNLFGKELGLKEMPEFFNDFGYKQLTYSYISTSRIESKYFDLGGFGPVVPDGYGFWYNLLENRIDMNLITMKSEHGNDVKSFGDEIIKSINDLVQLNED